jgi:hypothetical protein
MIGLDRMHLTAWMDRLMLYLRDRAIDGTWSDLYAIQGGPSLLDAVDAGWLLRARAFQNSQSTETHRRIRRKLTFVCDPWFLGCNQGADVNCTLVPFQHPLIRLRIL